MKKVCLVLLALVHLVLILLTGFLIIDDLTTLFKLKDLIPQDMLMLGIFYTLRATVGVSVLKVILDLATKNLEEILGEPVSNPP